MHATDCPPFDGCMQNAATVDHGGRAASMRKYAVHVRSGKRVLSIFARSGRVAFIKDIDCLLCVV